MILLLADGSWLHDVKPLVYLVLVFVVQQARAQKRNDLCSATHRTGHERLLCELDFYHPQVSDCRLIIDSDCQNT